MLYSKIVHQWLPAQKSILVEAVIILPFWLFWCLNAKRWSISGISHMNDCACPWCVFAVKIKEAPLIWMQCTANMQHNTYTTVINSVDLVYYRRQRLAQDVISVVLKEIIYVCGMHMSWICGIRVSAYWFHLHVLHRRIKSEKNRIEIIVSFHCPCIRSHSCCSNKDRIGWNDQYILQCTRSVT